jgi:recombination protein RecA
MPPRKKRTEGIETSSDVLINALIEDDKKHGVDAFFIGLEETPTDLTDFISTGASLLDLAISNRPNGGVPVGRITGFEGLEGSGKSLLCAHMIANVQKEGGIAIKYDTEIAENEEFLRAVGVNLDNRTYFYRAMNCVEDIFEDIDRKIAVIRAADKKKERKVLFIIDSIANMSTRNELEGEYKKEGYGTEKSLLISKAMRKILQNIAYNKIAVVTTNQLRQRFNAQPGQDPWVAPSGKALDFSMSVRVRLSKIGKIHNKDKTVVLGASVKAAVTKNRLGPPERNTEFEVYFDRGVDDVSSWIKYMKAHDIVKQSGSSPYEFVDSDGVVHEFKKEIWKQFIEENPDTFKQMYERIADSMVMVYSSENVSTLDGSAVITTSNDE